MSHTRRPRPTFLLEFSDAGTTLWEYVVDNNNDLSVYSIRGRNARKEVSRLIDDFIESEDYDYSLVLEYAQLLDNWNEELGNRYNGIRTVTTMIVEEVESALADRA